MSDIDGGYFLHWVILLTLWTLPVTVPLSVLALLADFGPERGERVWRWLADRVVPLVEGLGDRAAGFRDRKLPPADEYDWEEA